MRELRKLLLGASLLLVSLMALPAFMIAEGPSGAASALERNRTQEDASAEAKQRGKSGLPGIEELLQAIDETLAELREAMKFLTQEPFVRAVGSSSAREANDQAGCHAYHSSGNGWSSTTVSCSTQEVTRSGSSISISSSTSISSSVTSITSD